mmetsp:Transcript_1716/g.3130  ORF Transcript_1716/g.3130 Transcript_1716/m.3130 type:complete len:385 (+) Transcript_1716:312-1466(+)
MKYNFSKVQAYILISATGVSYLQYFASGFITSSHVFLSPLARTTQTTSRRRISTRSTALFTNNQEKTTFLRAGLSNDNANNDEDENDDVNDDIEYSVNSSPEALEQARLSFEQLMAIHNDDIERSKEQELHSLSDSSSSTDKTDNSEDDDNYLSVITKTFPKSIFSNRKSPPPLTTVLHERRLKEIELIKDLAYSNKSMDELWRLWITERGPEAAALLLRAEKLISIESWSEAESIILTLIEEHGIYWAEPVNRLATLYYMLGRYVESKALCELVLEIKPWHFGALSGIVMVCTAMNDASGARFWAENRLPPLAGERRLVWTENALTCANDSLREALDVARSVDMRNKDNEFRYIRAQLEATIGLLSSSSDDRKHPEEMNDVWQ